MEISVTEDNIEYSEKQYDKKDEIRKKRAVTTYKTGTTSYWEILFTSESMSDFFYRKKLLESIMEQDKQLLEDLKQAREEIERQKTELE